MSCNEPAIIIDLPDHESQTTIKGFKITNRKTFSRKHNIKENFID